MRVTRCFIRLRVLTGTANKHYTNEAELTQRLTPNLVSSFMSWIPSGILVLVTSPGSTSARESVVQASVLVLPLSAAVNPFLYALHVNMADRRRAAEARMLDQLSKRVASQRRVRNVAIMTHQ